jgi:hypothetical protein
MIPLCRRSQSRIPPLSDLVVGVGWWVIVVGWVVQVLVVGQVASFVHLHNVSVVCWPCLEPSTITTTNRDVGSSVGL